MELSIYIDFKSPESYLAMKPVRELIARRGLAVRWLPLGSREEAVPEEKAGETRGESHRRVRATARRQTHLRYAEVQGIPMNFPEQPGASQLALAALSQVQGDPLAFIEAAFRSYWVDQGDLDDADTVQALWRVVDPGTDLDLEAGLGRLEAIRSEAVEFGVFQPPAFVLGEQVFIGREHLPWIEELIEQV